MQSHKDFRVAIVGGGICGLTLAIALARARIAVELYECAAGFGEIGAGIGLTPTALRALESLGLLSAVLSFSGQKTFGSAWDYYIGEASGPEEVFYQNPDQAKYQNLAVERTVFLEALVPLLPPHIAHFNKKCIGVSHDASGDEYTVHFADGSKVTADIVVGADGIRSVVRKSILDGIVPTHSFASNACTSPGYGGNLSFTGIRTYRKLIPMSILKEAGVVIDSPAFSIHLGKNKSMVTYLVASGSMLYVTVNVADPEEPTSPLPISTSWTSKSIPNATLLQQCASWKGNLRTIISHMGDPNMWAIHHIDPPLKHYVRNGVILIGDAAHASTPFLGSGIAQGFEDIFVLHELLSHPKTTRYNVEQVLQVYDQLRPPRGSFVTLKSAEAGLLYRSYPDVTPEKLKVATTDQLCKVWDYDIDKDIRNALEELERSGVFS